MQDKPVALVTGANQGIGLQVAKDLVSHGFIVLVGSRNAERGQAAAQEIGSDAHALQLDVTDSASIAAAAQRVSKEFGRLDVLIQNAAISNIDRPANMTVEDHAALTRPSNVSLNDIRAIWETNVFGVLAVYQAMLPLLRATPGARIVNVSSGAGSLTAASNPAWQYRSIFGPGYAASKAAMNAMSLAMVIELEPEGIPVRTVSPGFTKTNLNGFQGTDSVEDGAREIVRVALEVNGPTGTFTRWENAPIAW